MPLPAVCAARHEGLGSWLVVNLATGRKILRPGTALRVGAAGSLLEALAYTLIHLGIGLSCFRGDSEMVLNPSLRAFAHISFDMRHEYPR